MSGRHSPPASLLAALLAAMAVPLYGQTDPGRAEPDKVFLPGAGPSQK